MILEVDVAIVRQRHNCICSFLELILLKAGCNLIHGLFNLGHDIPVYLSCGNLPLEVFNCECEAPVDEVAKGSHQLSVYLVCKDLPGEVDLLVVGRVAGQIVAQHIGMKSSLKVILFYPDDVSPRLGELLVIDLEHAAGHNCGWQGVSGALEHCRPEDAVVVDYVSADEVDDLGPVFPIALPVPAMRGAPLLGEGHVAYRRVNPDVDDQIIVSRKLDSPGHVAGYAPVLQLLSDPFDSIIASRGRSSKGREIIEQEILELGELEEVMNLPSVLSFSATDLADSVFYLAWLQVAAAAHVALVASRRLSTVGTFTLHVSVRQETLALGTVGQLDLAWIDISAIHEGLDHLLGAVVTGSVVSVSEEVEIYAHPFEDLIKMLVISGHQGLRRHSLGLGIDNDWCPVGIRAAYEEHLFIQFLQSSNEDVRRYIGS